MLEKKITAAQLKELLKNIKTGQIVTATFSGEGGEQLWEHSRRYECG